MAAGFTPAKASPHGPCEEPCEHTDCALWRRQIDHACRLCGRPIGYEARVYTDGQDRQNFVHADCLEDSERDKVRV